MTDNQKELIIDEITEIFREVEDNSGCHTKSEFADKLIECACRYDIIDTEDGFRSNFDEELNLVKHFSDGYLQTLKILLEREQITPQGARGILSNEYISFTASHISGERYRELKTIIDKKDFTTLVGRPEADDRTGALPVDVTTIYDHGFVR